MLIPQISQLLIAQLPALLTSAVVSAITAFGINASRDRIKDKREARKQVERLMRERDELATEVAGAAMPTNLAEILKGFFGWLRSRSLESLPGNIRLRTANRILAERYQDMNCLPLHVNFEHDRPLIANWIRDTELPSESEL
jgi:hypothetical protein